MSTIARKRKLDNSQTTSDSGKRLKLSSTTDNGVTNHATISESSHTESSKTVSLGHKKAVKSKRRKLDPPRPFPTVPTSVSATGPRSSHREGKNIICITRKTPLGSYLRRCKDIIIKDGYKTLYFSAMGAAIPQLLQLVCALPPILPYPQDEIKWEISTGTTEVNDELHPEDEDEDISYETRQKSTLAIVFRIGDGTFEGDTAAVRKYSAGKFVGKNIQSSRTNQKDQRSAKTAHSASAASATRREVIFEEPEQEEFMDML
ncbi:hypothetical protein CVT24_009001 [Panaeolus cyanescens]|uniref:Uncharacterized protein n=1 Tax=Panaeolus cyanescens TaxID=181874 RepID=A0A409YAK6_9AGAR|nr:hypothetical protein CVT24_009001 [Panaeolus cyanescens]